MLTPEETTVIDLLRRREAELVRVWECEEGIRTLLGIQDFPYPAVPDLPSRRKASKGASRRVVRRRDVSADGTGGSVSGTSVPALRRLAEGETCYRLEFVSRGRRESSFQTDLEGVRKLFQIRSDDFTLLNVSTVCLRSVDDWDMKETLWERQE